MEPSQGKNQTLESGLSVTRRRILSYARDRLSSGDFQRDSVRDMCAELGISRVTFYHHFRSKRELLDSLIREIQAEAISVMEGREYAEAVSCLVGYIAENEEIFRNLLAKKTTALDVIAFSRALAEVICDEFERQKRQGRKIDFDMNLAATYIAGGIVYILSHWVTDGYGLPRKEIEECLLGQLRGEMSLFVARGHQKRPSGG